MQEHCSYLGAFCKGLGFIHESHTSEIATDLQEANGSRSDGGQGHTGIPVYSTSFETTATVGMIKVSGNNFFS